MEKREEPTSFLSAKQHYLPASFIGRFSNEKKGSLRERTVWMLEKGTSRFVEKKAEDIGYLVNFYLLNGTQTIPNSKVDDIWGEYEKKLDSALTALSDFRQNSIDANTWLRVLVPFVASLFVRGPEFVDRFNEREVVKEIYQSDFGDENWRKDNTNIARVFEMQRLLTPVIAARWVVMHKHESDPFITNERSFGLFLPPGSETPGIAIPLGKETVLGLIPTWPDAGKFILIEKGKRQWRTPIERVYLSGNNFNDFNRTFAETSTNFIIGPSAESVEQYKDLLTNSTGAKIPIEMIWPDHRVMIAHEHEWYRLVGLIKKSPAEITSKDFEEINSHAVLNGWHPILALPTNLPNFPSGLGLDIHLKAIFLEWSKEPDVSALMDKYMEKIQKEMIDKSSQE